MQNITENTITVHWWTLDSYELNQVEYGENICPAASEFIPETGKFLNVGKLTGLTPGTEYKYRVRSGDKISKYYSFSTAPENPETIHFAFIGDGRTDNLQIIEKHRNITQVAMENGVDFAFLGGDGVHDGNQIHWARLWRQILTESDPDNPGVPFASNIPYYLLVGNHEMYVNAKTHEYG